MQLVLLEELLLRGLHLQAEAVQQEQLAVLQDLAEVALSKQGLTLR